jgi:hypothetical protein
MQTPSNPYAAPASEEPSNEPLSLRIRIFSSVGWGFLVTIVTYGSGLFASYLGFKFVARVLDWPSDLLVTLAFAMKIIIPSPEHPENSLGLVGIPIAILFYSLCAYSLSVFLGKRRRA